VRESGPVDGVLGFSQGAMMGGLLCALQESGELGFGFGFALLCGGFPPRDVDLFARLAARPLSTPSLHVIGEDDKMVTPDKSRLLCDRFVSPRVYAHPGGHYLPARRHDIPAYQKFIESVVRSSQGSAAAPQARI